MPPPLFQRVKQDWPRVNQSERGKDQRILGMGEYERMPIATNDIVRVTAGMLWNSANAIQNVFHYLIDDAGSGNQDDREDYLKQIVESIYEEIFDIVVNNVSTQAMSLFGVNKNEPYGASAWPTLTAGSDTGHAMPANVTVHSFGRTSANKVRGDKHWPIMSETNHIDGLLESDVVDDYGGAAANWINTFTDLGTGMSVIPGVVRSAVGHIGEFAPFVSQVTHGVVHTLRNRRPGVGS